MENCQITNRVSIPKMRFPGFNGEWIEKTLGDYFELRNGYAFKSDSYEKNGRYSIVTIANVQNGKLDTRSVNTINELPGNIAEHQLLKIGDIIMSMTGNVGRVCIVDRPNCLLNQRVGLLQPINDGPNRSFLYCVINTPQFESAMNKSGQGAAQANISKGDIESFPFFVPPTNEEQQIIADIFSSLEQMISAQEQKVESLKAHKQGLMQQLFPRNDETTPRLRFPGFTGGWEQKTVKDVFSRITQKNAENNQNVLTISAQYGLISQLEFFKKSVAAADVTGYYLLHKGDFAYNKSSSQGRPVGAIKPLKLYDKGVVSTLYICFRCKNSTEIDFWEQYFDAGLLDKELLSIAQEGARNHGLLNIPTSGFFDLSVLAPSIGEQQEIASCLSALDDTIQFESDKLDALKVHKKGLMQQLFPNF